MLRAVHPGIFQLTDFPLLSLGQKDLDLAQHRLLVPGKRREPVQSALQKARR
jgi:hypothetical protein